jgi:DNA-binding transcriptional MerR regulator
MALEKSPDAFRTISEVAEHLGVPAHVLRFWESRFTQIKPVKRAGGRRYYRRADMALIDGIRKLLHDDGMTIRAVQALLREKGVKAVAELARPLALDGPDPARPATADHAAPHRPPPDRPAPPEPHATAPAPGADGPDAAGHALPPDMPPPAEVPRSADPRAPETGTADHPAAEHMDAPLLPDEAPVLPDDEAPPAPEHDRSAAPAPAAPPPDAVPEAPMAQDVPVDDVPQVLRFIRSGGMNRPMPPPPAAPPTQSELDLAPPPAAPSEPEPAEPEPAEPPPAEPEPAPPPSLAVEVPDDPADDDAAHVVAPRTGFAALDPQVARGLRDRLAAIRRRLGDPPQRAR